jgi:hypothetical protein
VTTFAEDARNHRERKALEARNAAIRAAFFLTTGVEIGATLAMAGEARAALRQRLERLIERERLRGAARHWSYDLNRHIALKQALDQFGDGEKPGGADPARPGRRRKDGGTGRRRRQIRKEPSGQVSAPSCACDRGPSSWQAANALLHSSVRPSGRSRRGPTSRDTDPA